MTAEKKTPDTSARLGVKRPKPTSTTPSPSTSTSTSSPSKTPITPPKAATPTPKPKKEEVQRRKNYFNDMLNHRSAKEKERESTRRSTSSKRSPGDDGGAKRNSGVEGAERERGVDDRIAELEGALKLAREEQDALKEELAKFKEKGGTGGTGATATATSSPARTGGRAGNRLSQGSPARARQQDSRPSTPPLNAQSVPIDVDEEDHPSPRRTPRRSFHRQTNSLIAENHDLRAQVAQLQDQIQTQELAYQSRIRTQADWYELTSRLHATEKESQERLQQLLSLKSSISSLTRMDSQITDGELSEGLTQLANRIREWVVTNFRRAKLSFDQLSPDVVLALEAISPTYRKIGDRLALYQAVISNALMRIFREQISVGLPESGPLGAVRQTARHLYDASPAYREWRRCTIRSIENREGEAVQRAKEKFIHQLARDVAHQLHSLTSTNLTQHARSGLEGMINTAADFQHTLLLQKADYRMHFFQNQSSHVIDFDDSQMESINDLDSGLDDDGDVIVDRKFAFCVFPCLEKFGDEYGENTGVRNLLLRARVCCDSG